MVAFAVRWEAEIKQAANALASPIYSLPVEILREIVDLYLLDPEKKAYYRSLHLLRRVCVRWRHVVDGMPELWELETTMPEHALQLAIQKSRDQPLWVGFNGKDIPQRNFHLDEPPPIVGHMVAHHNRWGWLKLQTVSQRVADAFLQTSPPMLKSLRMSLEDGLEEFGGCIPDGVLERFISTAPSLEEVVIEGWSFGWDKTFKGVANLRVLKLADIDMPSVRDLLRMVSCCPHLQHLDVVGVNFLHPKGRSTPHSLRHPPLPSLQSLDLEYGFSAPIILNALSTQPTTWTTVDGSMLRPSGQLGLGLCQWIFKASTYWASPGSVHVQETESYKTIRFGGGIVELQEFGWKACDIRAIFSRLDPQWRATVTRIGLATSTDSSSSDVVDIWDDLFTEVTRLDLNLDSAADVRQILGRLSTPRTTGEDQTQRWSFPSLREFHLSGPASALDIVDCVTARLAASDSAEVTRLTRITAMGVERDLTRLQDLIASLGIE